MDPITNIARRRHLPVVLHADDVAIALRIATKTAARWLREGRLGPTFRIGRRRAILRDSFVRHLQELQEQQEPARLVAVPLAPSGGQP